MKERPILFSAPMVRAILDGRKSMTRRVMRRAHWPIAVEPHADESALIYQRSGHLLREWYRFSAETSALIEYKRPGGNQGRGGRPPTPRMLRWAKGWRSQSRWSIDEVAGLCPYGQPGDRLWVRESWAYFGGDEYLYQQSRGAVGYRADDVGLGPIPGGRWRPSIHMPRWASRLTLEVTGVRVERLQDISEEDARAEGVEPLGSLGRVPPHINGFADLWEQINGAESWDANPWVWAVEFRRLP